MVIDEEDMITRQSVEILVTTDNNRIASTSDSDVSQTPEKSNSQIPASSETSSGEAEYGVLRFPMEYPRVSDSDATVSPDESQAAMQTQRIALEWNQLNKLFAMGVTEEEKTQGFRWLPAPNPRYLGFVPGKNDKRKYLNVLPLVDAKPEHDFAVHLPIATGQRIGVFVFFLVFTFLAAGVCFYFRSMEQGSSRS